MRNGLGGNENILEQAIDVALLRERSADGVELFEPEKQPIH